MQPRISLPSVSNPADFTVLYKSIPTRPKKLGKVVGAMDMTPHILVVDDDRELRSLLSTFLTASGYRVSLVDGGAAMTQTMNAARIDLIILDVMMPREDGLSICRRLRASGTIPIIMLTAADTETDRVVGLEMGADDYLSKPFSTRELLARVRAVLRRASMPTAGSAAGSGRIFEFAGWRLDVTRRQLYSPARALVDLRAAEFDLLLALVERPKHVLNRDQLLDLARGRSANAFDRSIDVHISRLRHRMEINPKDPLLIKTARSGGYVFTAAVTLNGAPW
jgi:two-component system OmpR family response regulator